MHNSKFKVNDEVVFLTDSFNKGIRFTVTKVFFQMVEPDNSDLDVFSYEITNGSQVLRKSEDDLYWIPSGTINRPKEN